MYRSAKFFKTKEESHFKTKKTKSTNKILSFRIQYKEFENDLFTTQGNQFF